MPTSTMTALRLNAYSGLSAARIETIARPTPGPGDVAIDVRTAAINPVDWKIAEGFGRMLGLALPATLGCDVAGIVSAIGPGVTRFRVGDDVCGYVRLSRCGAFAEVALADENELARKPAGVAFAQAAALPVASLTAWQGLFDIARLAKGETVLVHAASGGVGSMAVQLAKQHGARVIGTSSGANEAFVRSLGVDQFIDYRTTRFDDVLSGLDVVFDAVGGETQQRSFRVLKRGGRLVSIVEPPPASLAAQYGVQATMMGVEPNGARLAQVLERAAGSGLITEIAQTRPLREAVAALEQSRTGRTRGKLILSVS